MTRDAVHKAASEIIEHGRQAEACGYGHRSSHDVRPKARDSLPALPTIDFWPGRGVRSRRHSRQVVNDKSLALPPLHLSSRDLMSAIRVSRLLRAYRDVLRRRSMKSPRSYWLAQLAADLPEVQNSTSIPARRRNGHWSSMLGSRSLRRSQSSRAGVILDLPCVPCPLIGNDTS